MCCGLAVYTPYDGGEVCSNLGFDERFVEGSVWSGDHQGGEQAESEVLKRVGDAAQTPGQTRRQTATRRKEKAAAVVRASVTTRETQRSDVVLLSQQEAHTQRVLPRLVWSQSVRAAGHMILSLWGGDIKGNVLNQNIFSQYYTCD